MTLTETRDALHAVAEHVLAPARHRATGRIGLRVTPRGFGTPVFPGPHGTDRQILVRVADLVVRDGEIERSAPLTTIGAAARLCEVEPGADPEVYAPVTPLRPDAPLEIDSGAAHELAAWFALVNEALQQFRSAIAGDDATEIQLWPEHFDVALTSRRVNYGGSPGDAAHPQPYLYVGPFELQVGSFWNEPFGASISRDRVPDVAAAVDFLLEGRDLTA